jgi:hypothetical protein
VAQPWCPDLGQALDRLRPLAAKVALDLVVRVDVLMELRDLVLGESRTFVSGEPQRNADLARSAGP